MVGVALVLFGVALAAWFGMHKLMPTISLALISARQPAETVAWFEEKFAGLSQVKKDYFCRLCRGQVYYVWATCCGTFLMAQVRSVEDLLYLYTDDHQFIYCIAAGEISYVLPRAADCMKINIAASWALAFWEDWKGRRYLSVRIDQDDRFRVAFDPNNAMLIAYAIHHTLTLFAYGFIISTGQLSSLGALGELACFLRLGAHTHLLCNWWYAGLLFEGPVIFANMREFVIIFDEDFDLLAQLEENRIKSNWCNTFCMLLLCRLPSGLLYLWALVFWRPQVGTLPYMSWVVYHALGLSFGCINMYWFGLLCFWCNQDMHRLDVRAGRVMRRTPGGGIDTRPVDASPGPLTAAQAGANRDTKDEPLAPLAADM
jgi:hypothetical protein